MITRLNSLYACVLIAWLSWLPIPSASAQTYQVLHTFNDANAPYPFSSVTLVSNTLYGTTYYGGISNAGMVFKVNTDGSGYSVLKTFLVNDGQYPNGNVTVVSNVVYGMTQSGGANGVGTIFRVNPDGTSFTNMRSFAVSPTGDGRYPYDGLVFNGGLFYGTTAQGGSTGQGTVFRVNMDGTGYTVLKAFVGSDGAYPKANVIISGNVIYGTTAQGGGSSGVGSVFRLNLDGSSFTNLKTFTSAEGQYLYSPVMLLSNSLYGTALQGGASSYGSIFKLNTDGSAFTVLRSFTTPDGTSPVAGLTAVGNLIYGVAQGGGASSAGTIFQLNTNGSNYTVVRNLVSTDGSYPYAAMILSSNTLYGTTALGGVGSPAGGVVFSLTLTNAPTIITNQINSHPLPGGKIQLDYYGTPGTNYVLDQTYRLNAPVTWIPVATNVAATDGSLHFTNSITSTNTFWRIRSM